MKKTRLHSFIATAVISLVTPLAAAYPVSNEVYFTCPVPSVISNFGGYIAGFGTEAILSQISTIYFQTNETQWGVPNNLSNYSNSSTAYDSVKAMISCGYQSSSPSQQPFDLVYHITNGNGGLIVSQTATSISVMFPIGFQS